ncbi:hypothetical protein G7Y79_00001g003750 [Physcia stellaris]|nr:hypothetical protein G7Y79_00001g003750 [Physcia stellaris]
MPRKDPKEQAKPTKKNVNDEFDDYLNEEGSGDSMSPSPTPTKSSPKKAKNGRARAVRDRPKKRNLIRWNETYDQRTLLAVQHVMSKKGMKIPWDEIGAELGPTITEGAIVQHLAKLRTRLESEGVKVTPPMKRGGRSTSNLPSAKSGNNNTKTVSAKGGVAKRTGNAKAPKKDNRVNEEADNEDVAMQDDPPAPRKAKAEAKKELGVGKGKGKSDYIDVKSEHDSENEDLKFLGARGPADTHQQGEYMSDHGSDDSHYQSEDDEGHDHQAVAVGAPFLALETSDRSSVASSSYSDISAPSKMVVLPIGRTLAKNLTQHDRNVHSGHIQDHGTCNFQPGNNMTPSADMGGRGFNGSQGKGGLLAKNGYSGDANVALEHDTVGSITPGTPSGLVKREQTSPPSQSKFAGYGMRTGPFDSVSQPGRLENLTATAINYQYGSANIHRGGYANSGFNSPNTTAGNYNPNSYGFPISTERHTSRPATVLSNEGGYLNPPSGQLQQSGFANKASTPSHGIGSYSINEGAINSSILSTQRGQISNGGASKFYGHQQSRGTPQTSAQSIAPGAAVHEPCHGFHFVTQSADNDPYDDVDLNFDLNDNSMWSYFDDQPAGGLHRGS